MRRALFFASAAAPAAVTPTTVKRGTVVVRDVAKHKNRVIKKGHSYVALG
jgi:hypothetical protein